MLEQDPAKINVQLIHFEKYAPFCMPGAEGTFGNVFVVTWLRTGGRTPFGWGGVVIVHQGWRRALGVCEMGVVSLRFSCDVCLQGSGRGVAFPLVPPSSTSDEAMKPVVSSRPRRSCRVVSCLPLLSPSPPPRQHQHYTHTAPSDLNVLRVQHIPFIYPYSNPTSLISDVVGRVS